MKLTRQEFLTTLGAVAAGAPLGAFAQSPGQKPAALPAGQKPAPTKRPGPRPDESSGEVSFAQCGEDLIVHYMERRLRARRKDGRGTVDLRP